MTCFGQQNVHGGDACHFPAEAFMNLWPSLQPTFLCCSNRESRYLDRDATKSKHADGVHSLKLHLLSTSLGVKTSSAGMGGRVKREEIHVNI